MRIGDDHRATICLKDIMAIRSHGGSVKVVIDQALHTHIDGQVNVITDGRAMQGLIDGIIERRQANATTEIVIVLVLDTR